jgi:hypothetical protein
VENQWSTFQDVVAGEGLYNCWASSSGKDKDGKYAALAKDVQGQQVGQTKVRHSVLDVGGVLHVGQPSLPDSLISATLVSVLRNTTPNNRAFKAVNK